MPCEDVIEQLSAYCDGQLPAAEMEAVRSHIAGCPRCRGELDALERTVDAVAGLPRLQAPSDLRDKVMADLDLVAPAPRSDTRSGTEEARPARWRMYWGAAAAIVFAVVIMLLTTPATPRRAEPEAVAPAGTNFARRETALADSGGSSGLQARDEAAAPSAAPAFETRRIVLMTGERIVLPSANPQAAYANAVAVAAKGGWLPAPAGKPAERRKDSKAGDLLKAQTEQGTHQLQVLQLTFAMKRSDVPLLKNALAAAGLQAAEEKSARVGAAAEQTGTVNGALRPASAPAGADLDQTRSRANAAPAEMKAPQVVVSAPAVGPQRQWAEPAAQPPETATYQLGARKAEAAEEPLVQVTLLFPLAESPVPARPAAAGAAGSVTPE